MEDLFLWKKIKNQNVQIPWKLAAVLLVAVLLVMLVRSLKPGPNRSVHIVVYAFSAEEEACTKGIFPAFKAIYEAETNVDLDIEGVFGPSGTLAGQINLGAPADIAILSNDNQFSWLQLGDRVYATTQPVVIGTSPVVIVTRPDLQQNLKDLSDLSNPGLNLLHADPHSSGVAEWALLAEYGEALMNTGDHQAAARQLHATWHNVHALAPSARALLTLYESGIGDAFLTYEQEALFAKARGIPLNIVIPSQTIIAQPVAVVIDGNVKHAEREIVKAFIEFLISDLGQEILSQYYLRPVNLEHTAFPPLNRTFTVEDLGGWSQAYTNLVKPLWEMDIEPNLELEPVSVYFDQGG